MPCPDSASDDLSFVVEKQRKKFSHEEMAYVNKKTLPLPLLYFSYVDDCHVLINHKVLKELSSNVLRLKDEQILCLATNKAMVRPKETCLKPLF